MTGEARIPGYSGQKMKDEILERQADIPGICNEIWRPQGNVGRAPDA